MSDWPIPPIAASPVPPTRCSTPSTRRRGQSSGRARTKSRAGITGAASPSPTAACTSARSTACSIALGSRGSFMKNRHAVLLFGLFPALTHAQFGRGGGDWMTAGSDAQRSSWIRTDAKISPASLRKGGFDITFKIAADPSARESLAAPLTLNSYIGYRGFRSLVFLGATADKVIGVDTDLGRIEWRRELPLRSEERRVGKSV